MCARLSTYDTVVIYASKRMRFKNQNLFFLCIFSTFDTVVGFVSGFLVSECVRILNCICIYIHIYSGRRACGRLRS